ncbi:MAG: pilus assembly protein N-terminal domain-containing protein [Lentisphaeria bacterium]|nr:pilus assembly protein N-terminal domain-containing protein [Lentisphaeria bacterium]
MLKSILTGFAAAAMLLGLSAADSEKIMVPLKGIVILSPGFKADDINITDRNIISAEPIANNQIRVTGLAVGKSDLHVTAGTVSKLYTATVIDNVREVFNTLRKDLDSVPEVEISINGNKVVLKGEVSSIDGWETLLKVLPSYGGSVVNLTVFRPAPEIMLSLKKLFEKAGFKMASDVTDLSPGTLSLQNEKDTLILRGSVYCQDDLVTIQQLISTQNWISVDGKDRSKPVKFLNKVVIKPTLLDVGAVFVGVKQADTSAVGANLMKKGINIAQGFNFSTIFQGATNQSYNLNADVTTILNLMAESGCKRFHRAGHLSFMSNDSNDFKVLHEGGTLKVRVYGGSGGTGTLNDVPYGFIMRARGGLIGNDRVKLDIQIEISTPALQENNDYDLKQTKVSTTIVAKLGETIALGGMKDMIEESSGPSGIPFLRKVPVLNWICAEKTDTFNDNQVLLLIYPQVAGRTPPLKMPPSAETANTLEESGKTNKQRTEEANKKKSFWDRWF